MATKLASSFRYLSPVGISAGLFGLVLVLINLPMVWDLSVHIWHVVHSDWRDTYAPGKLRSALPIVLVVLQLVMIGTITAGYSPRYPMTQALTTAFLGPFVALAAVWVLVALGYSSLDMLLNPSILPLIFLLFWPVGIICSALGAALRPSRRKSNVLLLGYSLLTAVLCIWRFSSTPGLLRDLPPGDVRLIDSPRFAGVPADHSPRICTGFQDFTGRRPFWGTVGEEGCPAGYAAYGAVRPGRISSFAPGEAVPLHAVCCPLPAADIFSGKETMTRDECPEGYVMSSGNNLFKCQDCEGWVQCREINKERYQLGPMTPGVLATTFQRPWREERFLPPYAIPAGLRYGLLRLGLYSFDQTPCLGYPFGSLLTAKRGKRCYSFIFRQLQFRGQAGDPPQGTPVLTYAQCDAISDLFDPAPACILDSLESEGGLKVNREGKGGD